VRYCGVRSGQNLRAPRPARRCNHAGQHLRGLTLGRTARRTQRPVRSQYRRNLRLRHAGHAPDHGRNRPQDVDFVIEGTGNIPVLREHLPGIRSKLGFTEVTSARQGRQYERYRRVFRNENNSTDLVITRWWTALQAPNGVVTTIRFRDATVRTPYQLAGTFPAQAASCSSRPSDQQGTGIGQHLWQPGPRVAAGSPLRLAGQQP
jgi:hypothetical protein